jgi:hypothetical protein
MYRNVTVCAAVALSAALLFISCDSSSGDGNKGEQIVITAPAAHSKYVGGLDTITVSFTPAMGSVIVAFNYNDPAGQDSQYATITSVVTVDSNTVKFVPPGRNMSDNVTIRISDASGTNTAGVSSAITVKHILLTAPADGSTQTVGVPFRVRWRCNGQVTGVNVKTSIDLGENWVQRNSGSQVAPADSTWENFPVTFSAAASSVLMRVELYTDPAVSDESVQPFSVQ